MKNDFFRGIRFKDMMLPIRQHFTMSSKTAVIRMNENEGMTAEKVETVKLSDGYGTYQSLS